MLSKNKIKFINSLKKNKFRGNHQQFIAEGNKLVREFINSSFNINQIISTKKWLDSITGYSCQLTEIIEVKSSELNRISSLKTPNNVLAVIQIPDYQIIKDEIINTLSIILDDIQDPGNLGTIIRIANWFGIKNIICSKSSVDVYNPKVVQATMGAICRVHVHYQDLHTLLENYSGINNFPVFGTFPEGCNIYQHPLSTKGLIILGNESKGISKNILPFISEKLTIPPYLPGGETGESLNVSTATAIVCSEFRRRAFRGTRDSFPKFMSNNHFS